MKTILKAVAALFIFNGACGYAQDFAGADFYEGLQNAREQLKPAGAGVPVIKPEAVDFQDDAAQPEARKEWTVMVFINGKNNLEGAGLEDINEMEVVGSGDGLNIVVELGQLSNNGMQRYLINKDTDTATIGSRLLSSASGVDMGDPASVRNFVLWAERRFPADKYMLILWDHGSGWIKGNPVQSGAESKGVSDDWVTGHNIDTPQLGRLMRDIEAAGARVDLLAFDACLMQMAEVAYEMKDSKVAFIAAAEEIEPGDGYEYDKWLAPLAARPGMSPRDLGVTVAREYLKVYPDGFQGIGLTYSVLEVAKMRELGVKMDALARAAMTAGDKEAVLSARAAAARYSDEDNKDLRSFSRLLASGSSKEAVKAAAADLDSFLRRGAGPVVFSGVSANMVTDSHGVAAYIPENSAQIAGYGELKLSADTQWDEFANWLLQP
jgi:hypothetical protein